MIYYHTPFQEIRDHPLLKKAGITVFVKREDLNHPHISGNKWWKLKYNLEAAILTGHDTLLTFGGAYSNHIYATAAAANELNLKSIGVIRGEEIHPLNNTLRFATEKGMQLLFVSRSEYRNRSLPQFLLDLRSRFGPFYFIPEGGTNLLAVKGCAEFAEKELADFPCEYVFLPVGTGGTMAGLICGLKDLKHIRGVTVLKEGTFLKDDIQKLVTDFSGKSFDQWSLLTNYHLGGYAKTTPSLISFMKEMSHVYDLPLDHVYTAKSLWAIFREVDSGAFARGTRILALHTGGLQGTLW